MGETAGPQIEGNPSGGKSAQKHIQRRGQGNVDVPELRGTASNDANHIPSG